MSINDMGKDAGGLRQPAGGPSGPSQSSLSRPIGAHQAQDPLWVFTAGRVPDLPLATPLLLLGRYRDVYGPVPFEMVSMAAWEGCMLGGSHDIIAYMRLDGGFQ